MSNNPSCDFDEPRRPARYKINYRLRLWRRCIKLLAHDGLLPDPEYWLKRRRLNQYENAEYPLRIERTVYKYMHMTPDCMTMADHYLKELIQKNQAAGMSGREAIVAAKKWVTAWKVQRWRNRPCGVPRLSKQNNRNIAEMLRRHKAMRDGECQESTKEEKVLKIFGY